MKNRMEEVLERNGQPSIIKSIGCCFFMGKKVSGTVFCLQLAASLSLGLQGTIRDLETLNETTPSGKNTKE